MGKMNRKATKLNKVSKAKAEQIGQMLNELKDDADIILGNAGLYMNAIVEFKSGWSHSDGTYMIGQISLEYIFGKGCVSIYGYKLRRDGTFGTTLHWIKTDYIHPQEPTA